MLQGSGLHCCIFTQYITHSSTSLDKFNCHFYTCSGLKGDGMCRGNNHSVKEQGPPLIFSNYLADKQGPGPCFSAQHPLRLQLLTVASPRGGLQGWTCPPHFCWKSLLKLIQIRRVFTGGRKRGVAPPPDPRYRLALRASHVCPPHIL